MRPNSHDPSERSVPRTERKERAAQVVQFPSSQNGYVPRDHNPYDGFDEIQTEDYNPYEDGELIDPDADDEAEVLQMRQGHHASSPRRIVRRRASLPENYDDRGGYPMGANTPLGSGVSSYDEHPYEMPRGGYRPEGEPSQPRRKQRRHARHRGLVVLTAIVVVLVVVYQVVFAPIDRAIAFSDTESAGLSQQLSWHMPGTPYYVLLLGSDAREGDTVSRTDTMMLARIDPIESKVTLVSIPRDTMVQIEGQGTQKINAAYAFGGAAGAVKAVSELTGVPIAHTAVVRFGGVSNLVDYLGGVTVNVPVAVNDPSYTGLVLSAGEHTMDGNTAMLFSRVRHGFAKGDYQRQEDQRILLQAILSKCLAVSPTQIPGLIEAVDGLVGTDMHCYSFLLLLVRFGLTHPTIYSCSLQGTSKTVGGASYEVLDPAEVRTVMARVDAGDDPSTDSATAAQQAIG